MTATPDPTIALFEAVSFAARAHRHQIRKDGVTPYVAHPLRVALVIQTVFGITDPQVLTAAVLHDTIEDTTTDYDDLAERFGPKVAEWVAALTKDMRLPETIREEAYARQLADAEWPVCVCKLADAYDNLKDSKHLPPASRQRAANRTRQYLTAVASVVPPQAAEAYRIVDRLVTTIEQSFTAQPHSP